MTQTTKRSATAILLAIAIFAGFSGIAQDWKKDKKVNILFGLAQPLLGSGFNIEGNYIYNRWIFDYSHGASLDFRGKTVTKDLRRQGIAVHEPYTTGFGVGYRIKEWINVRVEPKWHRFEFYYDGEQQSKENQIVSYNTFSLGVGIYGSYQPFKHKNNFLRGVLIAPSVRFWPTVSSSLKDDKFTYFNKKTNSQEEIKALDAGSGFTPLVINVSVGYSFSPEKTKLIAVKIKAIVFKTPVLNESRDFFEKVIGMTLEESSARHFVLSAGLVRIVFIESAEDFGIEFYAEGSAGDKDDIKSLKDPNSINIVIRNNK